MAENSIRPAVVDAIEISLTQFGELYQSLAENSRQVFVVGEALMDLTPVSGG